MNKRSDGKRRRNRSKRCRSLLGKKIGINIHEGIYANKSQAIAVAYSQIRKKHPSCRRILKSNKSRKSKRRSIRRRSMDGVQGTGKNGYLTDEEQIEFKNLFTLYNVDQHNQKSNSIEFKTFEFYVYGFGHVFLNKVKVYISLYTSWQTGGIYSSTFHIEKSENENVVDFDIIGDISDITKYIL